MRHLTRSDLEPKRIQLTIEWVGACNEKDWAAALTEAIEEVDRSRTTRVVSTDLLTSKGTTPSVPPVTLRALGYDPPDRRKRIGFWNTLRRRLWRYAHAVSA